MGESSIAWTDFTWNPIRARRKSDGKKGWACVRISPGCEHCYSENQNEQCGNNKTRHGTGLAYNVPALEQVEIYLDEETLLAPLHWKKPRKIFPCSMTDWMADFVPDEFRDKMLMVMALTPQHTYLSLTKRADRQRQYLSSEATLLRMIDQLKNFAFSIGGKAYIVLNHRDDGLSGISPNNLWVGVSCENQKYADERIPDLLQTPAAIRWVSAEPLLGSIDFSLYFPLKYEVGIGGPQVTGILPGIDWGVVGGESGTNARDTDIDAVGSIVNQFAAAGKPLFVKQLGRRPLGLKLKDRKGEDMSEWPKSLQVRQYPHPV